MTQALLEVDDLVAGYERDVPIVRGASLRAARGEIVAVLGPNGAGKSTFIKTIAGLLTATSGTVRLEGRDITGRPAHTMTGAGMAFVPQSDNVFAGLSVADNLKLATQRLSTGEAAARLEAVSTMFPDLRSLRRLAAGRLSGGQRQMLAVARALLTRPRVLLLDEPSAGLSPKAAGDLFRKLVEVRDGGVAVVLVEQNVRAALGIADRGYVLVDGRNRLDGPAVELAADPALAALYFGRRAAAAAASSPE